MSSPPSPGPYPGNPSLPVEVREKILATFRHALNLFSSGNVSDCLIGCEFILKMDPRFTPAQRLREKARNRNSDVDISELQALANPPPPGSPAATLPSSSAPAVEPRAEKPEPQRLLAEAELRAADPKHPTLPSLERRLAAASAPAASAAPDSGLGPPDLDEFALGGPQSEGGASTPAFGDLSSEPASLDPFPSPPSGFVGSEETSPEPDALVPPSHPSPDLFPPAEEAASMEMPSLPAPQTDEEDARAAEQEIGALLKRGDEMEKKGDRQQAIEIWSRVFLIDINNSEAVTRIEKTRQEMAEDTRMVAQCLKKGTESYEAGDSEAARKFFLQAQALDPDEPTARLYIERIEKGLTEPAAPPASAETARKPAAPAGTDGSWEPAPALAAAPPAPKRPRAALRVNPRVLAVIGAFLAMTLVGIYFVFKGTGTQAPPPKVVSSRSLQRARELLGKGEVEEARIELRRIGAADPDSEEARKLLADLSSGGAAEAGKAARPASPAGAASSQARGDNDPARLRAIAEEALSEKRYIEALKNFNLAAPAFRGDPNFAQKQALASDKVTALTPAVKFYNEGEYETAIPILWRIVQEDRDNQDARSYLLRSYYNQGITQLQNGLYQKAVVAFQETLALDPNDSEAARHMKFAERYQKGDLDLMGRIYVRHLNHRR